MILAQVIGTVVAQAEAVSALHGRKLLMVRPVRPDGTALGPAPRLAIDTIGAGVGDRVLVIDEGNAGRQILQAKDAPVKTLIVGFIDAVEVGGQVVYDHRSGDTSQKSS